MISIVTFLGRTLCAERVLVVVTYRSDELHRRHPLRGVLAELGREPKARRIELGPLAPDALDEQLADILGHPPERALAQRLWRRTGGNPLFTEELLAAGTDGRGAPPTTLRDAPVAALRAPGSSRSRRRPAAGGRPARRSGSGRQLRRPPRAAARGRRGRPASGRAGGAARALQVLQLVAGGVTDREVGAELFRAEKIASVHVSRILAKLGRPLADRGRRRCPPPGARPAVRGRCVASGMVTRRRGRPARRGPQGAAR